MIKNHPNEWCKEAREQLCLTSLRMLEFAFKYPETWKTITKPGRTHLIAKEWMKWTCEKLVLQRNQHDFSNYNQQILDACALQYAWEQSFKNINFHPSTQFSPTKNIMNNASPLETVTYVRGQNLAEMDASHCLDAITRNNKELEELVKAGGGAKLVAKLQASNEALVKRLDELEE